VRGTGWSVPGWDPGAAGVVEGDNAHSRARPSRRQPAASRAWLLPAAEGVQDGAELDHELMLGPARGVEPGVEEVDTVLIGTGEHPDRGIRRRFVGVGGVTPTDDQRPS
jgi:hypothetical protein